MATGLQYLLAMILLVPFFVGKRSHVSKSVIKIFNNWMCQQKLYFIWDIEKELNFLGPLDSEKLQLKMLAYKSTMLLALTGSSRSHEIYCLNEIRYLIKRSSDFTSHFSKITKIAKKS